MKKFFKEPKEKKINKKRVAIVSILLLIIIFILIISVIYIKYKEVRTWIDKNVLKKEVVQNNLPIIELDEGENENTYAFNKYIGILFKNKFKIYDNTGKKQNELEVEITKPIFNSNGRHLVIAEEKGQKLYFITDKDIIWEKNVEGNIAQVEVNKNGYVAVTISDTIHKTVIVMFDEKGNDLLYTYL